MPCVVLHTENGLVTTPTVKMPSSLAILATIGAAPVPGSPTHAGRDEHHVRSFKTFTDMILAFQCRILAYFRPGAGTQSTGPFRSKLDLIGSQRTIQCLKIGVRRNKIDAGQA